MAVGRVCIRFAEIFSLWKLEAVSNVLRLVLSRGLVLTTTGTIIGIVLALFLTRLLGNLLYQVSPRDPLAFVAAFAVMTLASTAACFLPAWRAARTDPMVALRHE